MRLLEQGILQKNKTKLPLCIITVRLYFSHRFQTTLRNLANKADRDLNHNLLVSWI